MPRSSAHFTDPDRLAITLLVELPGTGVIGDIMVRVEDAWSQAEVRAQAAGVQAEPAGPWIPRSRAAATRPRRCAR
jgi:hypothetical protein